MPRLVLDKNPEQKVSNDFAEIKKLIEQNIMNSLMYSEPFIKTIFLTRLISAVNIPVIYLDFDLLYSGYITAGIISLPKNVTLVQPTKNDWDETLRTILLRLAREKSMLVVDSLNNFFNFFDERKDVGRLVNSYTMFLVCTAKMSRSVLLLSSLVKRRNDEEWVLSTTGRQLVETKPMTKINLEGQNSKIKINIIENEDLKKNSYTISIKSEIC